METLGEKVAAVALGVVGASEHLQIAGLIREAAAHILDRDAAEAILVALKDHTWSIETNLDTIRMPSGPTWYEWPLPTRSGRGGGEAARTGCLVTPHPDESDLVVVVTAWEVDGAAMHAYGIALLDLNDLSLLSKLARRYYSKVPSDSLTRIMSNVSAFVPSSFLDEIEILSDGNDEARDAALRDATSEVPFLLALMVAMQATGGVTLAEREDGRYRILLQKARRRTGLAGICDRLRRARIGGFARSSTGVAEWIRA